MSILSFYIYTCISVSFIFTCFTQRSKLQHVKRTHPSYSGKLNLYWETVSTSSAIITILFFLCGYIWVLKDCGILMHANNCWHETSFHWECAATFIYLHYFVLNIPNAIGICMVTSWPDQSPQSSGIWQNSTTCMNAFPILVIHWTASFFTFLHVKYLTSALEALGIIPDFCSINEVLFIFY